MCLGGGGSGLQVAHPRHRAGACTLNAVGLLSLDVEMRGSPPLAPPPCVCGDVYLTLPSPIIFLEPSTWAPLVGSFPSTPPVCRSRRWQRRRVRRIAAAQVGDQLALETATVLWRHRRPLRAAERRQSGAVPGGNRDLGHLGGGNRDLGHLVGACGCRRPLRAAERRQWCCAIPGVQGGSAAWAVW